MWFRNPSRKELQAWLDHSGEFETPEEEAWWDKIDQHLATSPRSAAIVEELANDEGQSLTEALAAVFAPPTDFAERIEQKVSARLDSRVMMNMVSDLFGAGFETSRLLLLEEPRDE